MSTAATALVLALARATEAQAPRRPQTQQLEHDAAAVLRDVQVMAEALPQLPIPPPSLVSLAEQAAFEDGWDAALREARAFMLRALRVEMAAPPEVER